MTLTEREAGDRPEIEIIDEVPALPVATARPDVRRRRAMTLTAAGVVGILIVYAFFGSFVSRLWYQTRQRALAGAGLSLVAPQTGHPVGTLQILSPFTLNVQLVQGDGPTELESGPGHRPGTPLPGSVGNSVVYGHQQLWGAPFRHLAEVTPGTAIYLRTPAQSILTYTVLAARVVPLGAVSSYLGTSNDYRLTLVTDGASRFSDRRLVVVAVSGTRGTYHPPAAPVRPDPPGTAVLGVTSLELVVWLAAFAVVATLQRRTARRGALIAALTPLGLAILVWAFLDLAVLWSPLA